jgi:hypothetical protein
VISAREFPEFLANLHLATGRRKIEIWKPRLRRDVVDEVLKTAHANGIEHLPAILFSMG